MCSVYALSRICDLHKFSPILPFHSIGAQNILIFRLISFYFFLVFNIVSK